MVKKRKLKPLEISCNNAECNKDLHCFRRTRRLSKFPQGRCQYCGASLVNWDRVKERDLADVQNTFRSLKYEWIRHYFWEAPLTQRLINYARRKGRRNLETTVEKRIRRYVEKPRSQLFRDGTQTPFKGPRETIVTRAQHAVACCCRKCIEYWHGIPAETQLTEEYVAYFNTLIMMYIDDRLPDLADEGVGVARIPKGVPS